MNTELIEAAARRTLPKFDELIAANKIKIIWKSSEGTYNTHTYNTQNAHVSFFWGRYDLNLEAAQADFNTSFKTLKNS